MLHFSPTSLQVLRVQVYLIPSDDPDTPTLDVPLNGVGIETNGTISGFITGSDHVPIQGGKGVVLEEWG